MWWRSQDNEEREIYTLSAEREIDRENRILVVVSAIDKCSGFTDWELILSRRFERERRLNSRDPYLPGCSCGLYSNLGELNGAGIGQGVPL